jgi:hypothetical protein
MKRWFLIGALLVAALALVSVGLADPGKGKKSSHAKSFKFGPFPVHTTDNGSCAPPPGHEWANLTLMRTFKVRDQGNGTFRLRREDRGTFVTRAERSPGACETTDKRHGNFVRAGVTGKIHGYLQGTLRSATFNPNAACAGECTTDAFVTAFFGPAAGGTFTCFQGFAGCRFSFEYTAQRARQQRLIFHHWVDRGTNGRTEIFKGDIATS